MVIDSHCHTGDRWYEPVDTLLHHMDRHGVSRAMLIQMLGQFDNGYQQDSVQRHPDRFVSVVGVDLSRADACDELERQAAQGAVGVRLRPTDRSLGDDPLAIWRAAERLGLLVSCVGNSTTFGDPAFDALVAQFPRLTIVLEHLGSNSSPDADAAAVAARQRVFGLARHAHVCIKLPGLGELLARPALMAADPFTLGAVASPVLRPAFEAFGPERLLWGSDFPVVSSREGYGQALGLCREVVRQLYPQAVDGVFGGNAQALLARHSR